MLQLVDRAGYRVGVVGEKVDDPGVVVPLGVVGVGGRPGALDGTLPALVPVEPGRLPVDDGNAPLGCEPGAAGNSVLSPPTEVPLVPEPPSPPTLAPDPVAPVEPTPGAFADGAAVEPTPSWRVVLPGVVVVPDTPVLVEVPGAPMLVDEGLPSAPVEPASPPVDDELPGSDGPGDPSEDCA